MRTAKGKVVNYTHKDIADVIVLHKYSNVYKDSYRTGPLHRRQNGNHGQISNGFNLRYNTGIGTTGQDWFHIIVFFQDGSVLRLAPQNFRGIVDAAEGAILSSITSISKAIGTAVGIKGADAAVQTLLGAMLNSESTVGFKSHILRAKDEDSDACTYIDVYDDHVDFHSKSGNNDNVSVVTRQ